MANEKGKYNPDRKGFELKDGGLIRIVGDDKEVRIDVYSGNERKPGEHTRDTIRYNKETGKGHIDSHNENKTQKDETDISCFLTTACMHHLSESFNDNCEELVTLRWFRDNFVTEDDINCYYAVAPA